MTSRLPVSPPSRALATVRASSGAWERLRILQENHRIAMVGLSADPMRPSHFAAIYMQSEGYDVIPVNPRYAGRDGLFLTGGDSGTGRDRRRLSTRGGASGYRAQCGSDRSECALDAARDHQ